MRMRMITKTGALLILLAVIGLLLGTATAAFAQETDETVVTTEDEAPLPRPATDVAPAEVTGDEPVPVTEPARVEDPEEAPAPEGEEPMVIAPAPDEEPLIRPAPDPSEIIGLEDTGEGDPLISPQPDTGGGVDPLLVGGISGLVVLSGAGALAYGARKH